MTIDGRSLNAAGAGTQVHTLELIRALHAHTPVRLRVVLPPDPSEQAREALAVMEGVQLCAFTDAAESRLERDDLVHRPHQVYTTHDLRLLEYVADRVVITHQDQLLYRQPSYFATSEDWTWEGYRDACRQALDRADRVVFFTAHARRQALEDGLGHSERSVVVPIGVDHAVAHRPARSRRPEGLEPLGDRPFLLQLGSDLAHKNRAFSIALLAELRRRGWDGALVLAGPRSEAGSSREEEEGLLAAGRLPVAVLERVGEAERAWLLDHCDAVSFPSRDEGFGLLPFEAAAAGKPCLFAAVGSLAEILPREAAVLVPWDVSASAPQALELLADPQARDRHVALLRKAARPLTWRATARRMARVYRAATHVPLTQRVRHRLSS